jgi:hypothetical protein
MDFKPLAFRYLHQMCSPGGHFSTFSVPTTLDINKPGFYAPLQGRMWKVSRAVADELFGVSVTVVIVDHLVVEAWVDRRSSPFGNPSQFELMGYALILGSDIEKVIANGALVANIAYSAK